MSPQKCFTAKVTLDCSGSSTQGATTRPEKRSCAAEAAFGGSSVMIVSSPSERPVGHVRGEPPDHEVAMSTHVSRRSRRVTVADGLGHSFEGGPGRGAQ